MFFMLIAQAVAAPALPSDTIVVTASRSPEERADTAASVAIVDDVRMRRLGAPLAESFLRLTPSTAVSSSGPSGSLTEVRIRGAEANHTLLFIDGIRANDPAAGNTPRFELLNADLASRIEVVRGPQSALWGSEAIGGVIAVEGLGADARGVSASAEAGSFGFGRASGSASARTGDLALSGAVGWQRSGGVDSFDGAGPGDRDGYRNLSGRLRGTLALSPAAELGVAAFNLTGRTEYDGIDLITFNRTDTLDITRNRLSAGRAWVAFGNKYRGLSGQASVSLLGSSNRNLLEGNELNRTSGERRTASAQLEYRFASGPAAHTVIVAAEQDREEFRARDLLYGGASNQDRSRTHAAVTAEWRTELTPAILDVAVRRDRFSDFKDSTTIRASALMRAGSGWSVAASYGEGIAQPTFFDLYGFFPGNFVGNPSLKPESSRGFEGSLRYRRGALDAALTAFRQRLRDEIVPSADFTSTVNRDGASRRSGIEAEAGWRISPALRLNANYAYLRASEPAQVGSQLRELRRPKHSGSLALDGVSRRFSYAASLAYAGRHFDQQENFPYARVALDPYVLTGARIGYRVAREVELFARVSNAFADRYQDLAGYRTEGRGVFGGIRFAGGKD